MMKKAQPGSSERTWLKDPSEGQENTFTENLTHMPGYFPLLMQFSESLSLPSNHIFCFRNYFS